ncbi:aminoglycoside phosphotransferase family protein [Demequina sp. B12]|uniref:phosphotransferase enzyme family protein n=1 Tax=Demequina sp. B12 TaxID=2992757 RepID=UPI00237B9A83|nr:aminoglycoside phosphotransferase family protein [Demequina sp. B12]MDE0573547.1 aminoglycoside phosphotransferase family protein [Demequina sp. B12]
MEFNDAPEVLAGGNMGTVTRHGATVERPAGAWTPAVHGLLRHLERQGVAGVPRAVAMSADGTRETVTFVEGTVPDWPIPAYVWSRASLEGAAQLLRQLHDATTGADFSGPWRSATRSPAEVVCHHDFAPYNLVWNDGLPTGAIDWDFAAPGPRLWDVAYLAYRLVPLTSEQVGDGFTVGERRTRLRELMDAYGCEESVDALVTVLVARLRALANLSEQMATELDNPELRNHAALYRADAAVLEAGNIPMPAPSH